MNDWPALASHLFDDPWQLLIALLVIVVAYTLFSLMGFGTALVASTPLAWIMPVARIVPLLAVLDGASAAQRGWTLRRKVERHCLRSLLPGMLAGQILGVTLLAHLPRALMAVLLGGFVMVLGVRGFRRQAGAGGASVPAWRAGLFGGVLGGLFGSGGFIYAAWLQPRLPDRDAFRATQAVMISVSTLWRIGLCLAAGLIDGPLMLTALALLPATWLGMAAGRWLDPRIDARSYGHLLNGLLILSGLALMARGLG